MPTTWHAACSWSAVSRRRHRSSSSWAAATSTSSRRRRHSAERSATTLATIAGGTTRPGPRTAGAIPCWRWAPPPRAARPRISARSRTPGSAAARELPHPRPMPWRSRLSARPRYSTCSPATTGRSRCSTGPASSSAILPQTPRGRGRHPAQPGQRGHRRGRHRVRPPSQAQPDVAERPAHARVAAGHRDP